MQTLAYHFVSATAVLAARAKPAKDEEPPVHLLWEWIEDNAWVTYPALALLVIGLIAAAMISNARAQVMSSERRGQLKMQIMGVMRRKVSGVSAEAIAADMKIDLMLAAQLLNELVKEGLLSSDDTGARFRLRASGT